jgi:protoporphyrinogen oxidase
MSATSAHVEIVEFKPLVRNTLRGFLTAQFASGMIINEISVHAMNGRVWASPPTRPMVGKDGTALRDEAGKTKYQAVIQFTSKEVRDRWSAAILESLRGKHPEALSDGGNDQ